MKRRLIEEEKVLVLLNHHIREQLSILDSLPQFPRLFVGLAVNPPRLAEADVVLAVEVVEALAADLVAEVALDDEDPLSEGIGRHRLQPFLAEHLLLHAVRDDLAWRSFPDCIVPQVASLHKAGQSAFRRHVRQPQPPGDFGGRPDNTMEVCAAAVAKIDDQLLLLPGESAVVAANLFRTEIVSARISALLNLLPEGLAERKDWQQLLSVLHPLAREQGLLLLFIVLRHRPKESSN